MADATALIPVHHNDTQKAKRQKQKREEDISPPKPQPSESKIKATSTNTAEKPAKQNTTSAPASNTRSSGAGHTYDQYDKWDKMDYGSSDDD